MDRKLNGYDAHITQQHNMWNYLKYIYSVRKKNPSNFTGIDRWVSEKIESSVEYDNLRI